MAREPIGRKLLNRAQEATGMTFVEVERLNALEEANQELRFLRRDMEDLGYRVYNYFAGRPQEIRPEARLEMVQRARVMWANDPQAGASVALMNDFVLGRGLPRPSATDEQVQEVIDDAWDDPDNKLLLTDYASQVALNTDLSLQSAIFILVFDEGDDGKVKLGLLNHDTVVGWRRDPENRLRILYYIAAEPDKEEWDYKTDSPVPSLKEPKLKYYEDWRGVRDVELMGRSVDKPPDDKRGDGRVFLISLNRHTEMVVGPPEMQRTIRWFTAYNDLMKAQVDKAQAAAAFIMKRTVKGTPGQLARVAAKAMSRASPLAASAEGEVPGPRPASVLSETEGVTHEPFNLDSRSPSAMQDAQMVRAQISAGHRFPQSYYGDASNSSLATATSLELPVLKAVEARQEALEQLVRFFVDRVIEKAVDDGKLTRELEGEELEQAKRRKLGTPVQFLEEDAAGNWRFVQRYARWADAADGRRRLEIVEAHEDQSVDEEITERDLSYDFSMPSPLRRMMTDLSAVVATTARTFDPNNTNPELSRLLLTILLGEGLEVSDPAAAVERIFPEGYVDPAIAAAQAQAGPQGNVFGPEAAGQPLPGDESMPHGGDGAYPGAPANSSPPGQAYSWMQQGLQESEANGGRIAHLTRGRDGQPVVWLPPPGPGAARGSLEDQDERVRTDTKSRHRVTSDAFDRDVRTVAIDALDALTESPDSNGK